jgi:hypothetical protein
VGAFGSASFPTAAEWSTREPRTHTDHRAGVLRSHTFRNHTEFSLSSEFDRCTNDGVASVFRIEAQPSLPTVGGPARSGLDTHENAVEESSGSEEALHPTFERPRPPRTNSATVRAYGMHLFPERKEDLKGRKNRACVGLGQHLCPAAYRSKEPSKGQRAFTHKRLS